MDTFTELEELNLFLIQSSQAKSRVSKSRGGFAWYFSLNGWFLKKSWVVAFDLGTVELGQSALIYHLLGASGVFLFLFCLLVLFLRWLFLGICATGDGARAG